MARYRETSTTPRSLCTSRSRPRPAAGPRPQPGSFSARRPHTPNSSAPSNRCAEGLGRLGLKAGDRLLISRPTSPAGLIAFYAANRLGAVSALIHPLSTAVEITHYLDASGARTALVLDAFYGTLAAATPKTPLSTTSIRW